MNIKSKKERVKVGAHKGKDMFIMKMDYYNTVDTEKIIQDVQIRFEHCTLPPVSDSLSAYCSARQYSYKNGLCQ